MGDEANPSDAHETRLLLDTLLLGVVGALSAQLFLFLLRLGEQLLLFAISGYHPPGLPGEGGPVQAVMGAHGLWLIPVATTLGGLLSGWLVYTWAPEAEGHGTDTAVKAFHHAGGFIRARVAPLKMIASAITIGSGGAAGREGPTALITAGIGSLFATLRHRSEEERELLVLIGMAAGLSAIFRSPIGTAIFAIEVLYGEMEFESRALLYTLIGSIVAYAFNGLFDGWKPLFAMPDIGIPSLADYPWYVVLGVFAGLVGTAVPTVFYGMRDAFHRIPLPPHVRPALGGLGVGLMALVVPEVLGGGYGWIQHAIDGQMVTELLFVLIFAKMLAFALTVSSGGSGGVFAPTLFVGAMLGGFLAQVFHQPSAAFVVVGMAALFGAAARVPIATMLMVTEMTGGYHLLVPAGLAVALAYLVQAFLSRSLRYPSLYEAQVPGQSDSPTHHAEQLRIALRLLDHQNIPVAEDVGHLNFLALLKSGIPVDLPGGKRVHVGALRADSPCAGTTIRSGCLVAGGAEGEIIAIVRRKRLFLPHPNTVLEPGDQLIVLASAQVWEGVKHHCRLPDAPS